MTNLLSEGLEAQAAQLRERFLSADPFPHVVIDPLLDPAFCRRLADEFPSATEDTAAGDHGVPGRKFTRPDLPALGPAYRELDRLLRSPDFLQLTSRITGIDDLFFDPDYVGGGTHENQAGQELDPHIDFNFHPRTQLHRRLNLILFLNEEWDDDWGGLIEFHRDPWDPDSNQIHRVTPTWNRAVLFETSERSWHGFEQIRLPANKQGLSRRSIAVYFYTASRPPQEIAAEHATIYVPRPLPEHIRAGEVLSDADLTTIRSLLARRDQQIRHLYESETELRRALNRLIRHPLVRLWSSVKKRLRPSS